MLEFQALYHNYFRAPANEVLITPLQHTFYYDRTEPTDEGKTRAKQEARAELDVKKYTDSLYQDAPQRYEMTWPGGGIEVKSTGLKDLVVWRPQEEVGRKMDDMEEGGW